MVFAVGGTDIGLGVGMGKDLLADAAFIGTPDRLPVQFRQALEYVAGNDRWELNQAARNAPDATSSPVFLPRVTAWVEGIGQLISHVFGLPGLSLEAPGAAGLAQSPGFIAYVDELRASYPDAGISEQLGVHEDFLNVNEEGSSIGDIGEHLGLEIRIDAADNAIGDMASLLISSGVGRAIGLGLLLKLVDLEDQHGSEQLAAYLEEYFPGQSLEQVRGEIEVQAALAEGERIAYADALDHYQQTRSTATAITAGIDNLINFDNDLSDGEQFALRTLLYSTSDNLVDEFYSDLGEQMSSQEIIGFENMLSDLAPVGSQVGANMLAARITGEVVEGLGWNEEWSSVAGQALNVGVGAVANSVAAQGLGALGDIGGTFTSAYTDFTGYGANIDPGFRGTGSGMGNLGVSLVVNVAASELMEELGIGQTELGAKLAMIGSIVGNFIPIPFVGAAIGQIIGGLIGDLFGSAPPPPQAEVNLEYNAATGRYQQSGAWGRDGGDPSSLIPMGEGLTAGIVRYQQMLESAGGQVANRHELPEIVLGYRGEAQYILVNGQSVGGLSGEGFAAATGEVLNDIVMEGGNAALNQLLYSDMPVGDLSERLGQMQHRLALEADPEALAEVERLLDEQGPALQRHEALGDRQVQLENELNALSNHLDSLTAPRFQGREQEQMPIDQSAVSSALAEQREVSAALVEVNAELAELQGDEALQRAYDWHSVLSQTEPYRAALLDAHELDGASRLDYEIVHINRQRSRSGQTQFSLHETDLSDLVLVREGEGLTLYNRSGHEIDTPLEALPQLVLEDFGRWTNDRLNLDFSRGEGERVETHFSIDKLFVLGAQIDVGGALETLDMAVVLAELYGDHGGEGMSPAEALALRFESWGAVDADGNLRGGEGDQLLFASGGSVLAGGGDDVIVADGAANVIDGGAGEDVLSYRFSAVGVGVDLVAGLGYGGAEGDSFSRIEHVTGSVHGDYLRGDDGANHLAGMEGNDLLMGGGGDILSGGLGEDTVDYGGSAEGVSVWLQGKERETGEKLPVTDRATRPMETVCWALRAYWAASTTMW